MSSRALALLTSLAALLAAAAPASAARPDDVVLRLADLGPGYRIADESCVPTRLRSDGTSRVVNQIGRLPHRGCEITFRRAWVAPGAPAGPEEVSSRALVFDDPEGPALALTRPRAVVSFMYLPTREELEVVEPAPEIGDEAVLLRGPEMRFRRETWWNATVLWRSGTVLAAIEATGTGSFDAVAQAALRLAAAQQARIAAPTPLLPGDLDDLEVPLEDPRLDVPVWWVGRSLDGGPRLPRVHLSEVERLDEEGLRMALAYGPREGVTAFVLVLARPSAFARPPIRRELRRVRRDRCARITHRPIADGSATLYAPRRGCRGGQLEDAAAIVRLPGVRIAIAPEHGCEDCTDIVTRWASTAGVHAVIRALTQRSAIAAARGVG